MHTDSMENASALRVTSGTDIRPVVSNASASGFSCNMLNTTHLYLSISA